MHKSVAEHFLKIFKLVEEGKLPETAYPRVFYCGHELVCSYGKSSDKSDFKCVDCNKTWIGYHDTCPTCNSDGIFEINFCRIGLWRCYECKHEWKSENGELCPSCGNCRHRWEIDKCELCGTNKPEEYKKVLK